MFIARVSRGRTVREFITGVLLVPTLITFFWLSCFGGSAIYLELNAIGNIAEAVHQNVAVALFEFLEEYALFTVSSIIGVFMVTIFFVTSSDSGSLVVDSLTSGGKVDAPVGQRIFWAQTEGAVAAVLLIGGGLSALQTATITTGLPFALILLLMCYSLNRGLKVEYAREAEIDKEKERENYQDLIKGLVERRRGTGQEASSDSHRENEE
jgi:choline/glycine/proline betaine transport protein